VADKDPSERAFVDAENIKDPQERAMALLDLLPQISEDTREETRSRALSAAEEIVQPRQRVEALTRLLPHLNPDLARKALEEALSAAREIKEPESRAVALTQLIPYTSSDLLSPQGEVEVLEEAFTAAGEITHPQLRAEAFINLANSGTTRYREDAVWGALSAAGEISDPQVRAQTLIDFASSLPPESRPKVVRDAELAARAVSEKRVSARLLGQVAQLAGDMGDLAHAGQLISEALDQAEQVGDAWLRAQMLRLRNRLFEEAVEVPSDQPPIATEEPKASGAARRKAEELGIDLSQIEGTGSGGLITVKDVVEQLPPPDDPQPPPDDVVPPPRERVDIAARALADQPSEVDQLGFSDYATALADFIEDERTKKPLTIGIDAPWGMGKTTLMHMIESRLREDRPLAPPLPTVRFNAWKYDTEESLWAALSLEILRKIRETLSPGEQIALWFKLNWERLNRRLLVLRLLRALLLALLVLLLVAGAVFLVLPAVNVQVVAKHPWRYIGYIGGLGAIATLYNTIGKDLYRRLTSPFKLKIADYVEEPNYEEKVGFLAQFDRDFKRVIRAVTNNGEKPLVIFIDDLDRAAPPKPVEIFEAINMLLDSKHCVFVLGMDSQAVAKSIEAKYKDLVDAVDDTGDGPSLGRRFLEKIVQIPLAVPRADEGIFRTFITKNLEAGERDEIVEENREEVVQAEKLIEEEQRSGKTLDEAARAVQARVRQTEPGISEGVVRKAKVELRARTFGDSDEVQRAVADAVPYLEYNPRKVKRFINLFKLQALIANRRGLVDDGTIRFDHLSRWIIISTRWPAVVEAAMPDPAFMSRLVEAHDTDEELRALDDEAAREQLSRSKLSPLLADPRIRELYKADELAQLLKDMPLSGDQTSAYLYLTRVTGTSPPTT